MTPEAPFARTDVAIVGGGPAGLMAAEVLAEHGLQVDLFDAMPSVGRKFLLAGRGGLNLTHSEALEPFLDRYGARRSALEPAIRAFTPEQLRQWVHGLGITTFVGTSGRVFPTDMKAAPLLRAWLQRLRQLGVRFHMRHRWMGWADSPEQHPTALQFDHQGQARQVRARAVVLALGGASWPRLGSDGAWAARLRSQGVAIAPLAPANCGFDILTAQQDGGWSAFVRERFAGQPVKPVALSFTDLSGFTHRRQGEFVITESGVEGSLIYAFSAPIRDRIATKGQAQIHLDLLPDLSPERVLAEVQRPRGPRSLGTHLKSRLGIQGVKAALVHEVLTEEVLHSPVALAARLKALPLTLVRARPIAEAISSAGGVEFESLDQSGQLTALPGVYVAGEMLDWEAPTGGYLLTACMAQAREVAANVHQRLSTSLNRR